MAGPSLTLCFRHFTAGVGLKPASLLGIFNIWQNKKLIIFLLNVLNGVC
jgi:hypothetical protein